MKALLVALLLALPAAAEAERRPERWYQERVPAALPMIYFWSSNTAATHLL